MQLPSRSTAVLFGVTEIEGGFPHSEILGSKPVRGSPRLIAAYHVLHRLSAPRHPPDTLMTLDCSHRQSAFSRVPNSASATNHTLARKDQFCFKRIREPSGQAWIHDWCSNGSDFETNRPRSPASRPSSTASRPIRPSTECVSSSQCQISKGLEAESGQTPLEQRSQERRPTVAPLEAFLRERTDKSHRNGSGSRRSAVVGERSSAAARPKDWWSQTGSNRRPHACKARALPTELWPLVGRSRRVGEQRIRKASARRFAYSPFARTWWAWEDLNLRPHAYQARALTN